eukprot:EG_transcript_4793
MASPGYAYPPTSPSPYGYQPVSPTTSIAAPSAPPASSQALVYRCPPIKWQPNQVGYMPLSRRDVTAFQTFAPITVGYHFQKFLEPQKLCQSLSATMPQFYTYTGTVAMLNGTHHVKTAVHEPTIIALTLPYEIISIPSNWNQVIDSLPLRQAPVPGNKMLQVLFLQTGSQADGCSLLVTVDHVVADATSVAFFVTAWSKMHARMFGSVKPTEMSLPRDFELPVEEPGLVNRRIYFQSQRLSPLKKLINEQTHSAHAVTTNDILMAICAVAVAAHTVPVTPKARISMMVDPRGRMIPAGYIGNGAMPMDLYLDWGILRQHDLAAVTTALRRAVVEGVEQLKTMSFEASPPPPMQEALLEWNSWARAQNLLEANFGTNIRTFEWVNLRLLNIKRLFIIYPTTNAGGLALQVALPVQEMAYLMQIWNTYLPPNASA